MCENVESNESNVSYVSDREGRCARQEGLHAHEPNSQDFFGRDYRNLAFAMFQTWIELLRLNAVSVVGVKLDTNLKIVPQLLRTTIDASLSSLIHTSYGYLLCQLP